MKLTWPVMIVLISFVLLASLKQDEARQLSPFFKTPRTYKISAFQDAKPNRSIQEVELLELWESMLSGRSAPVSRWIKDQYRVLGLNHLFTPSGFHLSAALWPFFKIISQKKGQLIILLMVGLAVFSLEGQGALKRMVLIKWHQELLGQKTGFIVALILDVLWGSFADSPLSFAYSFLFLGLIYSEPKFLFLWFFLAQGIIAHFNGVHLSPLMLLLSPLLNFSFAMAMPFLLLLAIPLWHWQADLGLIILNGLQKLVHLSASLNSYVPAWEIHLGTLLCFGLFYYSRKKELALSLFLLSSGVNLDRERIPGSSRYDFIPLGEVLKIVQREKDTVIYFTDGRCSRRLIRGVWWEKCSPRRKSTRKKIKKLSYP